VRVLGPQGPLWEQADLPRAPLAYPPSAPPLQPGIPYQWQLEVKGFPLQQTEFRLLPPERSAAVRSDLASLDPARLAGYPKNTVLLMRAGYLFEQELYDEARRELQAAIAAEPDEPNLHVMLGNLYEAIGLADLAAEEFDEAQFLSTRKH
jgi:tetratricopeptide (TPR) repeat protein